MKVNRYMGKTNQEVLEKVKADLGNDAIILSTRKIRQKGVKGLFTKPLIEVVAAVDDSGISPDLNAIKPNIDFSQHRLNEFGRQINEINTTMDELLSKLDDSETFEARGVHGSTPSEFSKYLERLIDREVQKNIAEGLVTSAYEMGLSGGIDPATSLSYIISRHIGEPKPMDTKLENQKRVLFMGPTGVGKTTTLAKLAAIYSIKYNYDVGLITADTYRIGAADQLKTYSEILEIPLEIIYAPNEIIEPLDKFSQKDIIFIDTAGKSIKDKEQPEEIGKLLHLSGADEIFLCISAATSYRACVNIIDSYEFIDDYKIIYTKADEIASYGTILNCCYVSKRPISYITTGQSVPDDIEILDPSIIKRDLVEP